MTDQFRRSAALARERSWGLCEGCGLPVRGLLEPHHRQARQSGGVHGVAAVVANDVRNILALCRVCHNRTEDGEWWTECIGLGWRVPKAHRNPLEVPALLHTVNGFGWWQLTEDGGYRWVDHGPDWRITYR